MQTFSTPAASITKLDLADFHDAELTDIAHSKADANVLLVFQLANGSTRKIRFQEVSAFRVQDFGMQNVVSYLLLSTVNQFTNDGLIEGAHWVKSTSEGNCWASADEIESLVKKIKEERMVLFALVPSLGAELVIVARSLAIL